MNIRKAKLGDEKEIAEVIIDTWKCAYRNIIPDNFLDSLTPDKHIELFREQLSENKEAIFVLEDENKIVGMISGGKDRSNKKDCEIVAIYIKKNYQKRGFGKKLFDTIIKDHLKNNYKSMIIWTFEENKDRNFYEKLGGQVEERSSYTILDKEIPLVGFVWNDISKVFNTEE